jgi:hypothetical protein
VERWSIAKSDFHPHSGFKLAALGRRNPVGMSSCSSEGMVQNRYQVRTRISLIFFCAFCAQPATLRVAMRAWPFCGYSQASAKRLYQPALEFSIRVHPCSSAIVVFAIFAFFRGYPVLILSQGLAEPYLRSPRLRSERFWEFLLCLPGNSPWPLDQEAGRLLSNYPASQSNPKHSPR